MRAGRRQRRNRSEQRLEPIYVCTGQQFRIVGKIFLAVRTSERDYYRIALLQDDGVCTVIREVNSIPVLRIQPDLLRRKHAPTIRDRSPAVRGSCRLSQHFCLRERDVEASEQAHEPLATEVVLYCVAAVLRFLPPMNLSLGLSCIPRVARDAARTTRIAMGRLDTSAVSVTSMPTAIGPRRAPIKHA